MSELQKVNDREYYRQQHPTPTPEEYDGQRAFENDPVGMIRALRVDPEHGKDDWGDTAIDVLLAEIDGLKVELATLRAQLKPGQSDRECAEKCWQAATLATDSHVAKMTMVIASHVAPIRARLEEAEGLLRSIIERRDDQMRCDVELPPMDMRPCTQCGGSRPWVVGEAAGVCDICQFDNARAFLSESSSTPTPGRKEGE